MKVPHRASSTTTASTTPRTGPTFWTQATSFATAQMTHRQVLSTQLSPTVTFVGVVVLTASYGMAAMALTSPLSLTLTKFLVLLWKDVHRQTTSKFLTTGQAESTETMLDVMGVLHKVCTRAISVKSWVSAGSIRASPIWTRLTLAVPILDGITTTTRATSSTTPLLWSRPSGRAKAVSLSSTTSKTCTATATPPLTAATRSSPSMSTRPSYSRKILTTWNQEITTPCLIQTLDARSS